MASRRSNNSAKYFAVLTDFREAVTSLQPLTLFSWLLHVRAPLQVRAYLSKISEDHFSPSESSFHVGDTCMMDVADSGINAAASTSAAGHAPC
ncbi:hypothetical protein CBI36_14775 [Acetobacter oryzifermentans]|uniref:Uncharacterized protein n=2 Tax=Acetobacter TaxID=434 RepID=A0AAN1PIS3_9PROT|nr:hypothetical protein CBI36_14775 [Acetobacter oryzifermentans]AXN01083.1 hypothetical protein CJF59_11365 [Acetobacter pomorum]